MNMKKFVVMLLLWAIVPLHAVGAFQPEAETSVNAGLTAEAGTGNGNGVSGFSSGHSSLFRGKQEDRQAGHGRQKRVMNARKIGIAIVAPGGYIPAAELQRGLETLKSQGYQVFNYYHPEKRYQRFAATDKERAAQIEQAASNPEVKIVMALRGGYGTTRLLPELDFAGLAKSGKLFVGHSDFTAFEMALLKQGGTSFAGPMLHPDLTRQDLSEFTLGHFEKCMISPDSSVKWLSRDNPDIDVEGVLWGGNLTMLAHLTGTPWMPDISSGILFVEDIHEQPYRVERMLLQLDEAGILKKQKALVLGQFTEFRAADYDNGYDFQAMLAWLRSRLTIPVLTGLPFGHVKDKVTLPVGAHARLLSRKGASELHLSDYPVVW
ncbi:muramoyltetrapeptide carboxypeptidase [Oxalobacter paraformigenes]